jgi:hypothetical protein
VVNQFKPLRLICILCAFEALLLYGFAIPALRVGVCTVDSRGVCIFVPELWYLRNVTFVFDKDYHCKK